MNELQLCRPFRRDSTVLLAGVMFGLAATVRGNGILSGAIFLYDFVIVAYAWLWNGVTLDSGRRGLSLVLGGLLVGAGAFIPQWQAFNVFCQDGTVQTRPWCQMLVPSIFNFVQTHYW